jgi:phage/plasmid-like protein (TIGR03299 family)
MAHQIDTRQDGKRAAFIVGQKAWWQSEGEQLSEVPDVARAKELAGHGFRVDITPIYLRREIEAGCDVEREVERYLAGYWKEHKAFPNAKAIVQFMDGLDRGDETFVKIIGHNATVRDDRPSIALGVVGDRYTPFQNEEMWALVEPLIDAGFLVLETGGTLRGGEDVWVLCRLNIDNPVVQEVYGREGLRPYILLINNHSGTRVLIGKEVIERVVCANTAAIALSERVAGMRTFREKHTKTVNERAIESARKMFEGMVERHVAAAERFRVMRDRALSEKEFTTNVLDVLAPLPKLGAKVTARQQGAYDRVLARRRRIRKLWDAGIDHTGDHSAFEAFQAVTQSLDHDRNLWRVRGSQADSMIFGRLNDLKTRVMKNLVALSA